MRKFLRLIHLPAKQRHRAMLRLSVQALRNDDGGEVLEYALVAGLIVVGAIGMITCVGNKLVAKWSTLNSSI